MDEHGYPEETEFERIKTWDFREKTVQNFLAEIERLWHWPDWGFKLEKEGHKNVLGNPAWRLILHTGGWSGNESIVVAMEKNFIFWTMTWLSSRRGGHYEFEIAVPLFGPPSFPPARGE
jgi:hypothetical protein